MNTWLYLIEAGWVMIDTGYENSMIEPKRLILRPFMEGDALRPT